MEAKNNLHPEAQLLLNAIFQNAVEGIISIDRKGIIRSFNPAAARLFGYTAEEVIGNNISMLMPEPFRRHHDEYMENYHRTGKKKIIGIGREVLGVKKDGTIFPFNLGVSEVKLGKGTFYTGFIHDLTERKKREDEIKQLNLSLEKRIQSRTNELSETVHKLLLLNKQLKHEIAERRKIEEQLRQTELEIKAALQAEIEHNELKSRFVSMASHEFRTPLSTILSSISLIARYTKTEEQVKRDKHIERIKSAVNNLTNILNDFLSLTKLEEGKIAHSPDHFKVAELCSEVIDEMEGLLKIGQHFSFKNQAPGLEVLMDKHLLKNVLYNLLSNAIKYSDEGKPICCRLWQQNQQFFISIKDEGIGIPKEDQERLFRRFFRASNAANIQGTGLGLNIVLKYLELLKGKITFESQEGKGSTFTLCFELAKKL